MILGFRFTAKHGKVAYKPTPFATGFNSVLSMPKFPSINEMWSDIICWGEHSIHRLYAPNDFGSRWRRVALLLLAELRVALRTRTGVVAAFPEMHEKFNFGDHEWCV